MGVRREKVGIANGQSMDGAGMGEVESADESEGHLLVKMPAKKQRRACHGSKCVKIESRIDFTVSAACHVCRLTGSIVMPMFHKLTKDSLNDDALILKAIGGRRCGECVLGCNREQRMRRLQQGNKPLTSTNICLARSSSACRDD